MKFRLFPAIAILFLLLVFSRGEVAAAQACFDAFQETSNPLDEYVQETESLTPMDVSIKPLPTGAEGLAAKLALIKKAHLTIDISYYILKRDTAGYAVLHAIEEAMNRGVKVRILIDGVGSFHPSNSHLQTLEALNKTFPESRLEVRIFNPIFSVKKSLAKSLHYLRTGEDQFSLADVNHRLHDKILLIDAGSPESWAVLGGRNVKDDYYGLKGVENEIVDHEVLVKGGTQNGLLDPLDAITKHFEMVFQHELNLRIKNQLLVLPAERNQKHQARRSQARARLNDFEAVTSAIASMENESYWSEGFESTNATFVTEAQNVLRKTRKTVDRETWISTGDRKNITESVFDLMAKAKKNVTLISPYVLMNKSDIAKLRAWLLSDPEKTFDLYTNSLRSTNQLLVSIVFQYFVLPKLQALQKDPEIGDRLRISLYQGSSLLHAKAILIDDQTSLVTTSNFDGRSRIYNSEIGLWNLSRLNHRAVLNLADRIATQSVQVKPGETFVEKARNKKEALRYAISYYISKWVEAYRLFDML